MKNATQSAASFEALLKAIGHVKPPDLPDPADPIPILIFSFLTWESTTAAATRAYERLQEGFVDSNELRVSLPYEIAKAIGQNDPRGLDRCQRLRAVLNDLFRREHAVSLDRVNDLGRRHSRKYLESLEGMVPYVAARTALLAFDAHAVPVDDRLRALLIQEGVGDESMEIADLAAWLTRQVKASDSKGVHFALQAFSDEADARLAGGRGRKSRAAKATTKRKTTKKAASRTKKKVSTKRSRRAKKA